MTNIEWDATFLKVVEISALSAEEDNALEKNSEKAKNIISDLVKGTKNVVGFVRSDESGINLVVETAIEKERVTLKAIEDAHEIVQRISEELCKHAKAWSDARIEEIPPANVVKIAEPTTEAEQEPGDDCEEGFFITTFVPAELIDHIIRSILSASLDEEED